VPAEAADENLAAGDYVAVTVSGPGAWCTDWRWLPSRPPPAKMRLPAERLQVAGARHAYGRDLGATCSITVFLARRT
jgi:hypothetical protein